jgi:hypothetical protein
VRNFFNLFFREKYSRDKKTRIFADFAHANGMKIFLFANFFDAFSFLQNSPLCIRTFRLQFLGCKSDWKEEKFAHLHIFMTLGN